jgi:hypothetical protein
MVSEVSFCGNGVDRGIDVERGTDHQTQVSPAGSERPSMADGIKLRRRAND